MNIIKKIFNLFKNRAKGHKKITSFIIASIIVFSCVFSWLNYSHGGFIFRDNFGRSFHDTPRERTIKVYSGNSLIAEFKGYYLIEQYAGYYVLINEDTRERTDVYGVSVIIDNPA